MLLYILNCIISDLIIFYFIIYINKLIQYNNLLIQKNKLNNTDNINRLKTIKSNNIKLNRENKKLQHRVNVINNRLNILRKKYKDLIHVNKLLRIQNRKK